MDSDGCIDLLCPAYLVLGPTGPDATEMGLDVVEVVHETVVHTLVHCAQRPRVTQVYFGGRVALGSVRANHRPVLPLDRHMQGNHA